ncbi:putative membrane protein [Clostridium sp. CAG:594]|nr:putative membrane protein [Clostridium sp. CAG:594]
MSILFSWLSPLRAICMAIDGVLYSLLDNAYDLVIKLSTAELLKPATIKSLTGNLYIIFGVVAFFRLALLLVNAIIDPEKLNEKGKGLSNIFFRVVGMVILLAVTPFLFEKSYDLQEKIVGADASKNIIFKTILGNNANIASSNNSNAGKALQNIALSSLITIDENYLKNASSDDSKDKEKVILCKYKEIKDDNGKVKGYDYTKITNSDEYNFCPLVCVPNGDGTCTPQGGYVYDGSTCDWANCQNAVDLYNEMYVNEDMSPAKLAQYVGTSGKIDVDGEEQEVYVYNYMFIITGVVGVAMTYIIISFAIDIAVRMFELIVLEILSPLFIATFVDPKSAQSGPFKNWLSAVGKSYASLYIRLAIIALMVLLVSIINQSKMFQSMGDVSGWAKIFMVIGLLIFAKKAPKWIGDMIGIKGDGGLGGLSIGKKLGGMALAGGLASKGLDKLKGQGKKTLDNTGKKAKNALDRVFSGAVAANEARKQSKDLAARGELKDANGNPISRKTYSQMARDAAIAKAKAEQLKNPENDFRMFKGIRDKYASIAADVNPNFESSKDKKIKSAAVDAQAKLKMAGLDEVSMGGKIKDAKDLALTKDLYGSDISKKDKMVNPINAEQMNNSFSRFFNGSIPTTEEDMQLAAYAATVDNAASIDAQGNILDKNGHVLETRDVVDSKVADYVNNANPYLKQLWATTAYENNIQKQNEFGSVSENLVKSNQRLREAIIQRDQFLSNNPAPALDDPSYADYQRNLAVFENNITSATSDYNTYKDEKEKLATEYKKSAGLDENGITINEPNDNVGTIQVNGRYINKYGEYEVITAPDGSKQYKFVEKDMSDYYDLITQKMDDKLNGAKFKKKLDTIKEEYSIESKKVENKN